MDYLQPPPLIRMMLKSWFQYPGSENRVTLTFDDGPEPGITERVLEILASHSIQSFFFLTGEKALRHPAMVHQIHQAGHVIGSHGFTHPDAWKTHPSEWNQNMRKGHETIGNILGAAPNWFRPPYGHFLPVLNRIPDKTKMLLWTRMPGDFDKRFSHMQIVQRSISQIKKGDIIVLHDNMKSAERLLPALPEIARYLNLNQLS